MSTLGWIGLSALCALAAFVALAMRVGYPHHRRVAFAVWALGWIPFGLSIAAHRAELAEGHAMIQGALGGHWAHVLLVIGLAVVGYLVKVLLPIEESVVPELEEDELEARVDSDLRQLAYLFDKVEAAVAALADGGLLQRRGGELGPDDDEALRARWAAFVEASYELDVLQAQYRGFTTVNPVSRTRLHARCFLVAYGAYVCEYRASVAVTREVGDNDTVQAVLNEANARHGIAADTYLAMQRRTMHPDTLVRLNAGRAYLKLLEDHVDGEDVFARTKAYLYEVEGWLEDDPEAFVDNPLDYLERVAFDAWFPVQTTVTKGLSAIHVEDRECFITADALQKIAPRLEPADTLLMRREWHLTNLGIPGYWTHAALYVGTLDELDAYFDGAEALGGRRFSAWLQEEDAFAYEVLASGAPEGRDALVLEAVTKGVRVAPLAVSGLADSLAGLRPRCATLDEKLIAVRDGLRHLGKAYDFNFDFATDNTIVCSELVYKAYERLDSVHLELGRVNGRLLLSPNAFCEKLDAEWEGPRELDHVVFLDGLDHGRVVERDADALRTSHARPKWHILVAEE